LVKLSATNYDTTWAGPFLPTAGGEVSGLTTFQNGIITDTGTSNLGGTVIFTGQAQFENGLDLTIEGYGITFFDNTTQTTAGLPLTGGTLTGALSIANAEVGSYNFEFGLDTGLVVNSTANGLTFTGDGLTLNGASQALTIPDSGLAFGFLNNTLGSGILFSDATTQTTAFPGYTGTTSEYIDGTGDYVTFPEVGDRYLTTSTSTLTINNANGKTMTVETGLSYSTQQDITVSYNASNHMHGTVVSYNSSTGVLVFDANQHTGSGTYSNWEVNVGGVAGAILPVGGTAGQVLAKVDGVNFNTEWISLGNVALNNYATTAQAQAGTSTNTVISPATLREMLMTSNVTKLNNVGLTGFTTGTGGTNDNPTDFIRLTCPNSAANVVVGKYRSIYVQKSLSQSANMSFANGVALQFRLSLGSTTGTDPNSTGVIAIGEGNVTTAVLPSVRSIGVQLNYGSNIKILAHDGTTLTTYTTSTSVASLYINACDFLLTNDYATGTVTLYLNGTSIGSTTGGVTTHASGFNARNTINARAFNQSVPSGSQLSFIIYNGTAIVL
jgi:hypothetical protein